MWMGCLRFPPWRPRLVKGPSVCMCLSVLSVSEYGSAVHTMDESIYKGMAPRVICAM
jgi:hypothetical protein